METEQTRPWASPQVVSLLPLDPLLFGGFAPGPPRFASASQGLASRGSPHVGDFTVRRVQAATTLTPGAANMALTTARRRRGASRFPLKSHPST